MPDTQTFEAAISDEAEPVVELKGSLAFMWVLHFLLGGWGVAARVLLAAGSGGCRAGQWRGVRRVRRGAVGVRFSRCIRASAPSLAPVPMQCPWPGDPRLTRPPTAQV